ncbi:MAG: class I SAM-dependent methyltransferase [Patescibacteria group bacterium]|nr:class I SAM-dependent methyltransferase [Patescibacteria group bacterium]
MRLTPRQQREKQVYDTLARNAKIIIIGDTFPIPNREAADFFPYFLKQIGEVKNEKILEIGSGPGFLSCWLTRLGANVQGIDVSENFVDIAVKTAKQNNLSNNVHFQVATAEKLPFENESFDIIVGNQILHHLEIPAASKEIYRVLKSGGRAVFCEPIGFSKKMERFKSWVKKSLNHPDHRETPDEKILNRGDFDILCQNFRQVEWRGFQLFATKIARLIPLPDFIFYPLLKLDWLIMWIFPWFRGAARLMVAKLEK